MWEINSKFNIGDTVYYLADNANYVTAIPKLRKLTVNRIIISGDDVIAYGEDIEDEIPEEELFSSEDEAIEFITKAIQLKWE